MALDVNFESAIVEQLEALTDTTMKLHEQAVYQDAYETGSFATAHTLQTGVREGKLIPIILAADADEIYCSMPYSDGTDCSFEQCETDLAFSSQKWQIAEYNCREAFCFRTMTAQYEAFWGVYKQTLEDPSSASEWAPFWTYLLENRILPKIRGTHWRNGYFGDADIVGNDYLEGINGYFTQAAAGDGEKHQITMAGSEPTGQELIEQITTAIDESDALWLGRSNVRIKMGWSAAKKIASYLNSLDKLNPYNCECISADGLVSGNRFFPEGLRINGILVDVHREIDGAAGSDCVNGNKWQILIAPISNLVMGVETTEKMDEFRVFYDKKDRQIYVDLSTRFGVALLMDEYIYLTTDAVTT